MHDSPMQLWGFAALAAFLSPEWHGSQVIHRRSGLLVSTGTAVALMDTPTHKVFVSLIVEWRATSHVRSNHSLWVLFTQEVASAGHIQHYAQVPDSQDGNLKQEQRL